VLGAALWMLHPLLVSTTLYAVQREAMLPATFSLLGMLLWMRGRDAVLQGRRAGLACLLAGAWGCTALAVLCKANGVLLPMLLACLEWIIPSGVDAAPGDAARLRRMRWILLGLPSLLIALWLLGKVPAVFSGETYSRPWTIGQRLLSEARVLCDYLGLLWIPQATGSSVFNDGFPASHDWLHPWTTLPAVLVIVALLATGLALRRRHPALSFALLFYLTGQLLESTVIPLELYFEHRNYLPALPMFWPLALWLTGPGRLSRLRLVLALVLPLILAALCHARAGIWGHPYEQALLLAEVDPQSPRAQANAAAYEMAHGRSDLAAKRLAKASRAMPDEAQLALNWIAADCHQGAVSPAARAAAHFALSHDHAASVLVQDWLAGAIQLAREGNCRGLDLDEVDGMIQAMLANSSYGKGGAYEAEVQTLLGKMALARSDGAAALRAFDAGLQAFPTMDRALLQAALLGSNGYPDLGLAHLRYSQTLELRPRGGFGMSSIHFWVLDRGGYWNRELSRLENQLRQDAQEQHGAAPAQTPSPNDAASPPDQRIE
jgi:tetratricopeptide (TPR) repeat protein